VIKRAILPAGEQWFRFQAVGPFGRSLSVMFSGRDETAARAAFERVYGEHCTEYSVDK
jgi:hypothetical protein